MPTGKSNVSIEIFETATTKFGFSSRTSCTGYFDTRCSSLTSL